MLGLLCGIRACQRVGWLARLRRLLAAVVWAALGVLSGALLLTVHAFRSFAGETLIARVTTERLAQEEFTLIYRPVEASAGFASTVRLHGDQWMMSGGIIKWHPWLTALGIASYHKPMRLSGQFSNLDKQRAHPPTVYALTPGTDWVWEALYRADPYLPFVEAAYGSAASVYVEPDVVQEVYVTPTGYLIKRRR